MSEKREPRPFTADQACDDLAEFIALAEYVPAAAQDFEDCFEFGRSVIVCHHDPDATMIAGKHVFRFELNETLAGHLAAFRARQIVDSNR